MNRVIGGFGLGCKIDGPHILSFKYSNYPTRVLRKRKQGTDNSNYVVKYEIIDEKTYISEDDKKKRASLGGFFAGSRGAIVGALTAKQEKSYTILIHWARGEDSIIELDEEYYKTFLKYNTHIV